MHPTAATWALPLMEKRPKAGNSSKVSTHGRPELDQRPSGFFQRPGPRASHRPAATQRVSAWREQSAYRVPGNTLKWYFSRLHGWKLWAERWNFARHFGRSRRCAAPHPVRDTPNVEIYDVARNRLFNALAVHFDPFDLCFQLRGGQSHLRSVFREIPLRRALWKSTRLRTPPEWNSKRRARLLWLIF